MKRDRASMAAVAAFLGFGLAASWTWAESPNTSKFASDNPPVVTITDPEVQQVAYGPLSGRWRYCPQYCPPTAAATAPVPGVPQPEPAKPGELPLAPETAAPPEGLSPGALASTLGATAAPTATAPQMIGDFFGGGARFTGTSAELVSIGAQNISVGTAGGDRRFKIVESNSPIPQDRAFFNYHHFVNPLVDVRGQSRDLDRYTLGLEKTFGGGDSSIELRTPFTGGYDSFQSIAPGASLSDSEFGNLGLAVKRVLTRNDRLITSAGLGMVFPTGEDWKIVDASGPLVVTENDAFHLQPFLGAVWQPNARLFFQAFTQIDFDTNGNSVLQRSIVTPGTLGEVGVFQEQALWFLDLSAGYWIHRDPCARWITGIAPVIELHYSTTLQDEDFVSGPQGFMGSSLDPVDNAPVIFGRRDVLNLTAGLHFAVGECSTLTVAGVAPLRHETNRDFDGEFAVEFTRRF